MSHEYTDKLSEHAEQRERGMTDEAKKTLEEKLEGKSDWYGTCPRCKVKVKGTIETLKEHRCAKASS